MVTKQELTNNILHNLGELLGCMLRRPEGPAQAQKIISQMNFMAAILTRQRDEMYAREFAERVEMPSAPKILRP